MATEGSYASAKNKSSGLEPAGAGDSELAYSFNAATAPAGKPARSQQTVCPRPKRSSSRPAYQPAARCAAGDCASVAACASARSISSSFIVGLGPSTVTSPLHTSTSPSRSQSGVPAAACSSISACRNSCRRVAISSLPSRQSRKRLRPDPVALCECRHPSRSQRCPRNSGVERKASTVICSAGSQARTGFRLCQRLAQLRKINAITRVESLQRISLPAHPLPTQPGAFIRRVRSWKILRQNFGSIVPTRAHRCCTRLTQPHPVPRPAPVKKKPVALSQTSNQLLRILFQPSARPTASRKSSAEISLESTSSVTALPDSPRLPTARLFHPGFPSPCVASAEVNSAKDKFAAHSLAPPAMQ